jgi:hypothetical protein
MAAKHRQGVAHVGDGIEVRGIAGGLVRRGRIVEILGVPGHEHFQVRWNENHESMVFPGEGVRIVPSRTGATPPEPG